MERNFDYVTMDDYSNDMKEQSDYASGIIRNLTEEKKEFVRCIYLLLEKLGGEARIPFSKIGMDEGRYEIKTNHDRVKDEIVIKGVKLK